MGPDDTSTTTVDPGAFDFDVACTSWTVDKATLACSVSGGREHADVDGIYTMPAGGGAPTRVTRSPERDVAGTTSTCDGGDAHPELSPDGKQIAFIRTHCGTIPDPVNGQVAGLFVVNADGSGERQLNQWGLVSALPDGGVSWSPDGQWIVLSTPNGDMGRIHPDGSGLVQIKLDTGAVKAVTFAPEWSPDGSWIAFSMWLSTTGETEPYFVKPDGSGLTQLTDVDGSEDLASWGP